MKNILAIDYGTRRWGLAFCDELRVVFTIPAATQPNFYERLKKLAELIKERKVDTLLVGHPLTLEGKKSKLTLEVESFVDKHLRPMGLTIIMIDEALTSFAAEADTPKTKVKQGRPSRDGTVDSKAAAILLEDFLAQQPALGTDEGKNQKI